MITERDHRHIPLLAAFLEPFQRLFILSESGMNERERTGGNVAVVGHGREFPQMLPGFVCAPAQSVGLADRSQDRRDVARQGPAPVETLDRLRVTSHLQQRASK